MPIARFQMQDGRIARFEVPDGTTPEQAQDMIRPYAESMDKHDEPVSPKNISEGAAQKQRIIDSINQSNQERTGIQNPLSGWTGAGEALLNMATGIGSSAVGGLAGAGRAAYGYLAGDSADEAIRKGAETTKDVQNSATYQPRTGQGKLLSELASLPVNATKEMLKSTGGDVGQVVGGDQGRITGEAIGNVLPDVALTLAGGRTGLKSVRDIVPREIEPMPGRDFTPLRDLSPEESARMQQQTDQGLKPTLASVTRDPQQFRFEDQIAKTEDGAALRERELSNNDALVQAIQDTDNMRQGRGNAQNERETGQILASTLEKNSQNSLKNVGDLYNIAKDSGETEASVNTHPLERYLEQNKSESIAVPALRAIANKLEYLKEENNGIVTINDLENLYKSAGKLQQSDASASSFMREVKSKINDMTEGEGGDLYRQARQARLEHALEYEDRGAISRLIDKKAGSRTDYKTASEDVFNKTVVNSSLAELQDVSQSLLSKDPKSSPESWQAVRELQAQTIDYLLNKSIEKSTSSEHPTFSPAAYRNAIKNIGTEKLSYLLGEDALNRLQSTLENAQDIKTSPGRVNGSDSFLNFRDAAERLALDSAKTHLLGGIPVVGKMVGAVGKYMQERAAKQGIQDRISESLIPRRAALSDIRGQAKQIRDMHRQDAISDIYQASKSVVPVAAEDHRLRMPGPHLNTIRRAMPMAIPHAQAPVQRVPMRSPFRKNNQDVSDILNAPTIDEAINRAEQMSR